ncbi:unnamed protein product [Acanthoscelides obtectus]|uniref:Uncharacterized protein n=1 Tax=Acanthoscelides obtectus TaxID=200917 RepID=A0A9P0M7V6_ACAOB|nr:unnamed protein product [Acanthoscelides obtectus]CAK1643315.1 hypothetical protein AOBTE_LOCUS13493 [Acanthoscelides obtectus]
MNRLPNFVLPFCAHADSCLLHTSVVLFPFSLDIFNFFQSQNTLVLCSKLCITQYDHQYLDVTSGPSHYYD